jgi:nucleoid-associated protein YgaU
VRITQQPSQHATSYVVGAGDSLWSIAKRVYHDSTRWCDIVAANPGLDPRRLRPGEAINLPGNDSHGQKVWLKWQDHLVASGL